jgi:ubiquinone/menaquinone biosynthesis C-methylase UbiE
MCLFSLASLHFGRAERLPFVDEAFDQVESRMEIAVWAHENRQMHREALAEMVRVTVDGGTLRIASVDEDPLRTLVSERSDLFFVERQFLDHKAFELKARRQP